MWCNLYMKVGIIGNGVHSKRIQKILKKNKFSFFIYKPNNKNYYDKEKFDELKKNKIIFILSPNKTHLDYIKQLHKNHYIFCEKPPVSNKKEIIDLKKISYKKIYFNFNFRFSKIAELLKNKKKYNLGDILYANIAIGHGLAKKKEYVNSWRADRKYCKKGVFEIVSIHWIDLINYLFKVKKISNKLLINHSGKGNSFDTSHIQIKIISDAIVNIFTTYNSPLINKIIFVFENGIIEQNEKYITIKGPALNLDKNNFFRTPKLIKRFVLNANSDYNISLETSVKYFLKTTTRNKFFNKKLFNSSINSNLMLF